MKKFTILLVAKLFFISMIQAQQTEMASEFLNNYLKKNKTPGIQYVVMKDNKVIYDFYCGYVEMGKNEKISTYFTN